MQEAASLEDWLSCGEGESGWVEGESSKEQIQKDIPRTEPRSITEPERAALERMLCTFPRRFPSIGYCQGMNFVALAVLRIVAMGDSSSRQAAAADAAVRSAASDHSHQAHAPAIPREVERAVCAGAGGDNNGIDHNEN
jgi:hypothetical protein